MTAVMDECFAELTTAGSQGYLEYSRTVPRRYLLLATHPDLPRQEKGSDGDDPHRRRSGRW